MSPSTKEKENENDNENEKEKEKENPEYYEKGFFRYDVLPQNSFKARGLEFGDVREVRGSPSLIRALAWNCNGHKVASGSEFGGLRIHDVVAAPWSKDGTPTPHAVDVRDRPVLLPSTGKSPHHGHVATLAWSPKDPRILVSGCKSTSGGVVCVWNIDSPSAPVAMFKISGDVLHVAFHPSGRQFAAVCPRSTRDEVFFYWLVKRDGGEKWEQRSDIVMGGAGIDIGVEEVNALRFWPGGDAVLSVSNDGSLNSWKYPVEERPPLVDERPTKRSRIASPVTRQPSPDTPEPEAKGERKTPEDDREGEGEEKPEGEDGRATPAPADVPEEAEGATADGDAPADAEAADGTEAKGEPAGDAAKADAADTDGDVKMGSASPAKANGTAPPTPADTPAATAPPTAAPSRQPTPAPATPAAEDKAVADEKAAKEAAAKAAAAAELERRKHRQLEKGYRQVIHVSSLLALAVDPLGRFFAIGGNDARVSLLDTVDWIVQRTFDEPVGAIRQAAFSPDGEFLAVGGDDPHIYVLSVFARKVVKKYLVTPTVNALAWHPTRNTLAWSTNHKPGTTWYYASQE